METLPPVTLQDLETAFQNTSFSTYVFIGDEGDVGYENAEIAFGLIPRLRVYRADRVERLREDWRGEGRPGGIAFDWNGNPVQFLDAAQARDLRQVIQAIKFSRQQT
jgi:hypothetical protein